MKRATISTARKATFGRAALLHDLRRALLGQPDRVRRWRRRSARRAPPSRGVGVSARVGSRGVSSRPVRSSVMAAIRCSRSATWPGSAPAGRAATGSGPSVILLVSTVSLPLCHHVAKRSRLRGAGPAPGPWCPDGRSASRGRGTRTSSSWCRSWACSRGAGSAGRASARWCAAPSPAGCYRPGSRSVGSSSWT